MTKAKKQVLKFIQMIFKTPRIEKVLSYISYTDS